MKNCHVLRDYRYNIRGWLTSINNSTLTINATNNPSDTYSDLFGMELMYESGFSSGAINSGIQYNGNISGMKWKVNGGSERGYGFEYDDLNRLGIAKYAEYNSSAQMFVNSIDNYTVSGISTTTPIDYDKNGNIEKLYRKGALDVNGTSFGYIDKLEYDYDGNRLKSVNDIDNVWKGNDFKDGVEAATEYTYDDNGNMITDANKGIVNIEYNVLNLPEEIDFGSGNKIRYFYAADGVKQKKEVYESSVKTSETSYKGSFIYEGTGLAYVLFDEGRLIKDGTNFKYEYFLKDHLGNNRILFTKNTVVEKLQEDHYYPFGMTFQGVGSSSSSVANKYKYNGKELQDELDLDWYDYGARFYDPALGRWHSVDPLAEERDWLTPYNYVQNNSLLRIDPDGRLDDIIDIEKSSGNITVTQAAGDDVVRLVDNGSVEDSYTYGSNGSFTSENVVEKSDKGTTATSTNSAKADEFYRFAAGSEVEFAILDVQSPKGDYISVVATTHEEITVSTLPYIVLDYSKKGFTGIRQSHSHPGGTSIPAGHYGYEKGNPYSLMPYTDSEGKKVLDAGNAVQTRSRKGFGNTKFEVYNPVNKTKSTYDGVHRAKINLPL